VQHGVIEGQLVAAGRNGGQLEAPGGVGARRAIGAFDPDLGTLERSRVDQTIIDDPAQQRGSLPACRSGDHNAPACNDQGRSNGGATDHAVYNTVTTSDG